MDKRIIEENIFKGLMIAATFLVLGSLFLILLTVFLKGIPVLSWEMLTQGPQGGYYIGKGGGILNAILGSLILGVGATLIAFLVGLPIAFYLNLYLTKKSKLALLIRFALDVLWGIPSIVYG